MGHAGREKRPVGKKLHRSYPSTGCGRCPRLWCPPPNPVPIVTQLGDECTRWQPRAPGWCCLSRAITFVEVVRCSNRYVIIGQLATARIPRADARPTEARWTRISAAGSAILSPGPRSALGPSRLQCPNTTSCPFFPLNSALSASAHLSCGVCNFIYIIIDKQVGP